MSNESMMPVVAQANEHFIVDTFTNTLVFCVAETYTLPARRYLLTQRATAPDRDC